MAEFTVGQEVLLVRLHRPRGMEPQEPDRVKISRVGRKYVYIQRSARSQEEAFDAQTGREKTNYTPHRRIVDPIVYAREQQVTEARQWLRSEGGIGLEYSHLRSLWTDERILELRDWVEDNVIGKEEP